MNPTKESEGIHILLVEDDSHDRIAFRRAFERSNISCTVTECERAEEALVRLRAKPRSFDLVVIDHGLPGMSGADLCKVLLSEQVRLPVVILTGRGSEELAVEALKAGVDDYIVKDAGQGYLDLLPVVLPQVVRQHGDRLGRERAEQALREAYDELERRVEERTAELARATFQLKQELTERRRTEEALRESEEKYHALFDYDPNSIFVLNANTLEILDVNVRALEVYGYNKEELIGKSFKDLGGHVYREGVLAGEESTPSTLSSVYPKVRHRRQDGSAIYVNVYACKSKGSHKYGIIATTVDITESLERESQLIQASKMSTLGEMATGMAHELNQPLSSIQLGADFFKNVASQGQTIPREELAFVSEQISAQVTRAVSIINHLREFGRKTEIQREKIDINQPLKAVFSLLSEQLKMHGIKVILDLQHDLPFVFADGNRLEQVFIDLVVNARDAMGAKREGVAGEVFQNTLIVKTFRKDGQIVVTMADTGVGIPDDLKEKIFEPFFTTKEVGKGTGLGLSISYGIVKDYDGMIEVESEVGKGTTFTITFPACNEKQ